MRTRPIFYGWWVTLSFMVMVFLSTGIRFTVGPFLKPVVAELGLDRASFSLVISLSLFLYGAFQPFVGRLVDRVFAAAGLAATGHVVGSAVIARWLTRRRATALSTLGGASMAGMSMLVPVAMWLILTIGWRATSAVFGLGVLVLVLPLVLWVVREAPETMGLRPDGEAPAAAAAGSVVERTDVAVAVQTLSFWQLASGLFTCGFSMSLISAHGVPMLTDHGFHPMLASWALGVLGGSSVGFSILVGLFADRFGRRPILAWLYGGRGLLFAGLFLVRDNPVALLAIAVLGGATMAGSLAMTPGRRGARLVARRLPLRALGRLRRGLRRRVGDPARRLRREPDDRRAAPRRAAPVAGGGGQIGADDGRAHRHRRAAGVLRAGRQDRAPRRAAGRRADRRRAGVGARPRAAGGPPPPRE